MKHLRRGLLAATMIACAATALPLQAQDKPPLKILVGFPPGGSADIIARLLADAMRDDFSNVIVENKPGAAGRIALNMVKTSKPDGQTVLVAPSGPMVVFPHVFKKLDYDPVRDFTPVSQLARFQFGIVAGPAAGVTNIAEMLAKAKADPKTATYASSGQGTVPHFIGVQLEQAGGVTLTHVPFQGGAPANTALLGGHVGYKVDVVTETLQLHRDGKVRIIAVAGATRDPQVPDVPTLKEQGVNMEASAWFGMYAPAGLGGADLARLERAVARAIKSPALSKRLQELGFEPLGGNSAELAAAQRADLARWEKPIKATGIQLD
ncbi:MAG: Bug family tripartite tricarboxylate transporter substrate binding protein [Aquabacterium sp.]